MKTKKIFLGITIMSLLGVNSLLAQIPVLEWRRQMGGTAFDESHSIAVDASGNVYITGYFYGTADFDPGPGTANLNSNGTVDIFVQKLDAHGNFLWVKQMGGINFDEGLSIAVDHSGNVYTTGSFEGTVDFDPGVGTANLTSLGSYDIFVQKLDVDGNYLWAKRIGGNGFEQGLCITIDASDNVYTTGCFQGTVDFDPGTGTANLNSVGGYDIFIQKLDANGNYLWAKQMGGVNTDSGNSIAVDNSGNVYTTGYFFETADFDPGSGTANLSSHGSADIFVQKIDANGNYLWAKQMGATVFDEGLSIAIDASGNVYTTGYFEGTADFDPGSGTANLTSFGSADIFVQKLDANGNFLWAKQMGGTSSDIGFSIDLDTSGNVYTTGYFQGTADFNPGAEVANFTSGGSANIFIQKLDTHGNYLWARQMVGSSGDTGKSIALDASGNLYITGWIQGTTDFDPYEGTANLTSIGDEDIFVQKLYPCYPTAPVPNVANLPVLSPICKITNTDAPTPKATSNCVGTITASTNTTFPITDQTIKKIVWIYDDKSGNIVTQNQSINWTPMDVTTSLSDHTVTANNINGTYRWLDCNNNNVPLSGKTEQSFIAIESGNYAVEITEKGCVDTSSCISIIISDINEFKNNEKLVVFPNPSSNSFKVEFGKIIEDAILEITDIQGQLVFTKKIQNSSDANIVLNKPKGLYLLKIKLKEGPKTIVLIKE
jgi:hypothetical protein